MLVRVLSRQPAVFRRLFSAAPPSSSGIEHAEEFKKIGARHKMEPSAYKCSEYLNFRTYSYYDTEVAMAKSRVVQPSNKKPDVLPSMKN
ncbi:hypothetical protein L596_005907 [Steinernema carpocapsae]|uniref:Uncharacterized protein n=1 Tax=Steinernema carpocapsae TaxID=34508 RepID=A0A4U8V0R6_STECR|nr:hypothetical protein L596_005907 [Steinernema carpocapsae]